MATEDLGKCISRNAGSAITQFRMVKLNTSGDVVPCDTDGELAIGVAQMDGSTGDPIPVMVGTGVTKITAGETISPGDTVGTDTSGRAGFKQATNTGADLGDWIMGTALTGGVVGELIEVLWGVPTFKAPPS